MKLSYNIYRHQESIGFSRIEKNDNTIKATLLLFEDMETGQASLMIPTENPKKYSSDISDIDIVKDLLSTAIPDVDKAGKIYSAKKGGVNYELY